MKKIIKKLEYKEFPKKLLEIPKPPKNLYLKGLLPDPENNLYLTVVGSRKYSSYGREACEKLISELMGHNIVIVSGLAHGIDSIAHKTAIKFGLKTIAVPGSGIEEKVLYPSINRRLAEEIINSDGALLTEFEPDQQATLYTFPQRNRIMAGISDAVLVIEAGEKSGTLITAKLAVEYNRELLVVPGSIFSPNSKGSNMLINQGATPVSSGKDILKQLGIDTDKKQTSFNFKAEELSDEEKLVVEILSTEPMPKDELLIKLNLPINEANTLLSIMEIKGIILETLSELRLNI